MKLPLENLPNENLVKKTFPKENLLDFTEYVQREVEEKVVDLGLFFDFAEEDKIVYNQTPINTKIEDM